jgi:hypothetical protein
MTIQAMADGIKTVLDGIAALDAVYSIDEVPGQIGSCPCAIIYPPTIDYDPGLTGFTKPRFKVHILVNRADIASNITDAIAYAEGSGTNSVPAAIAANYTLSGAANWCVVEKSEIVYTEWNGIKFTTVEFTIFAKSPYA